MTKMGIPSSGKTATFGMNLTFTPLRQRYQASIGSTSKPRPIKNLSSRSGLKKGAGG